MTLRSVRAKTVASETSSWERSAILILSGTRPKTPHIRCEPVPSHTTVTHARTTVVPIL